MAGKQANIAPMWERLRKEGIDLEPPVPLSKNVYLGCGQKVVKPNMAFISQKREMFQRICHSSKFGKPTSSAEGDLLKENSQRPSADDPKPSKKKKKKAQQEMPTVLSAGETLSGLKMEKFLHTHMK